MIALVRFPCGRVRLANEADCSRWNKCLAHGTEYHAPHTARGGTWRPATIVVRYPDGTVRAPHLGSTEGAQRVA